MWVHQTWYGPLLAALVVIIGCDTDGGGGGGASPPGGRATPEGGGVARAGGMEGGPDGADGLSFESPRLVMPPGTKGRVATLRCQTGGPPEDSYVSRSNCGQDFTVDAAGDLNVALAAHRGGGSVCSVEVTGMCRGSAVKGSVDVRIVNEAGGQEPGPPPATTETVRIKVTGADEVDVTLEAGVAAVNWPDRVLRDQAVLRGLIVGEPVTSRAAAAVICEGFAVGLPRPFAVTLDLLVNPFDNDRLLQRLQGRAHGVAEPFKALAVDLSGSGLTPEVVEARRILAAAVDARLAETPVLWGSEAGRLSLTITDDRVMPLVCRHLGGGMPDLVVRVASAPSPGGRQFVIEQTLTWGPTPEGG